MKKTIYSIMLLIGSAFALTSCSDWLDVSPKTEGREGLSQCNVRCLHPFGPETALWSAGFNVRSGVSGAHMDHTFGEY